MSNDKKPNPQDKPENLFYFLDGKKIDAAGESITGVLLRAQLGTEKAGYALYLESQGSAADQLIKDTDTFVIEKTGPKLRFYSVPSADFGLE